MKFLALNTDESGTFPPEPAEESAIVRLLQRGRVGEARVRLHKDIYWEHVDLDTATIRIKAANAKDRDRRIVEIRPNLAAWLRPLAKKNGRVLSRPLGQLRIAARNVLGLAEWPADVMRHSFVSYHFAEFQNEAATKRQVGHRDDGRIFYNHYMVPVSRPIARQFWGIVPPRDVLPCMESFWLESHPPVRLSA